MAAKFYWFFKYIAAIFLFAVYLILPANCLTRDPYDPSNVGHHNVHDVYKGCGYVKNCVKLCPPDAEGCKNCILHHNCPAIVTLQYIPKAKIIKSQMLISHLASVDEYIAMGLSTDGQMRKSPFVACVSITNYNGSGNVPAAQMMFDGYTRLDNTLKYVSVNSKDHFFYNREIRVEATNDDQEFADNFLKFEISEGPSLKCSFEWKTDFKYRHAGDTTETHYNLIKGKQKYHIIAAKGSAGDPIHGRFVLRGHTRIESGRTATLAPILLTKVPYGTLADDYDEYYDGPNADNHFRGIKAGRSYHSHAAPAHGSGLDSDSESNSQMLSCSCSLIARMIILVSVLLKLQF